MAAIGGENGAGHQAACVGCEQQKWAVEFIDTTKPAHRNCGFHRLACGRFEIGAVDVGDDIAGRQRVDADIFRREFERERFRQLMDGGLRGAIGPHAARDAEAEDRADNNNCAMFAHGNQTTGRLLRGKQHRIEIKRHYLVPSLLSLIDELAGWRHTGIGDQQIDRAEGFLSFVEGVGERSAVGDIGFDGDSLAAFSGNRCDLQSQLRLTPCDKGYFGAMSRQDMGEAGTEPARRAGDEGRAAREIEEGRCFHAPHWTDAPASGQWAQAQLKSRARPSILSGMTHHDHDHDHDHHGHHHHDHDHDHSELSEVALRVRALETILTRKGLVDPAALDAIVETYETKIGPRNGARVVARAWTDPAYLAHLRENATAAIAELGYGGRQGEHMQIVENTPDTHNMVVCTLCSCYPWPVLGLPPVWYKSAPYRSRAVIDPRGVLKDFGVTLPDAMQIRVWDSTAEMRYLVLPMRPAGTENWSEEQLAHLVTRDSMIGTGLPLAPGATP